MRTPILAVALAAVTLVAGMLATTGCSAPGPPAQPSAPRQTAASASGTPTAATPKGHNLVDADTTLAAVIGHASLDGFGQFLVPNGGTLPDDGRTLRDVGSLLPYHRNVDAATSVDVVNELIEASDRGRTVYHPVYPESAMVADPSKRGVGLFHFSGDPGAPFAIVSAGGGFSYVGSIHESLPHALELSRHGYHGFALQYRTGGLQVASEDLAAALSYVFAHAEELQVSTAGYSLWGGSAGARMAATVGARGPAAFGGDPLPRPAVVVLQYTGYADVSAQDPPTYACVGQDDAIADWRTMQRRLDALSALGVATEFHVFPDVGHGFGLGVGTSAEGWTAGARSFWERHR